jgi:hypothetical protein
LNETIRQPWGLMPVRTLLTVESLQDQQHAASSLGIEPAVQCRKLVHEPFELFLALRLAGERSAPVGISPAQISSGARFDAQLVQHAPTLHDAELRPVLRSGR